MNLFPWQASFHDYMKSVMAKKKPKLKLPKIFQLMMKAGAKPVPNDPVADLQFVFGQCRGLNYGELLKLDNPIDAFDYLSARGHRLNMITGRYYTP